MDTPARIAAFEWLKQQTEVFGDVLQRDLLVKGFIWRNERVPLLGPQGIFKPRIFPSIPLSITTTSNSPYHDSSINDGYLEYQYRGINPNHHENVGLRMAMEQKIPLVYFFSPVPSKYFACWPVYIIGEMRENHLFRVAFEDQAIFFENIKQAKPLLINEPVDDYRRYIYTNNVKQRLHQRGFRERVLSAYQTSCALCRIKHAELLDAAHIIPDGEEGGEPTIDNGIALCKIHHSAFDNFFFGIRPNFTIEIRNDILEEKDGPMLEMGFKGLNNGKIILPRNRTFYPSIEKLKRRYEQFRKAM
jgi:putative restriction endonuclease